MDKRFVVKNGIDNNNKTIANVAEPVNANDAANRVFVENKIQQIQYFDAGTAGSTYDMAFDGGSA